MTDSETVPSAPAGQRAPGATGASEDGFDLTFIGNATMLLRFGPLTVLTDPNFLHKGEFAYLGHGLVSRRRVGPALAVDDLPPLDAVVLSHMHGDHWDRRAKAGLDKDLPVYTTPKAAQALVRQGFGSARGLRTWDDATLERDGHSVRITALPGRHAVGAVRHLLPPVMGSLLEYTAPSGAAVRLYITGDTLFVDDLRAIPRRFPDVDVAALHLGGTRIPAGPRGGFLVTMDARQGVDLIDLVRPRVAVPIHHEDYGVFGSPLRDFENEAARRGVDHLVRVVPRGQTVRFSASI